MAEEVCHVLVCTNVDCKDRGSQDLLAALKARVEQEGLTDVVVKPYLCFGGCQHGPNIVLYPSKIWYAQVTPNDLDEIVAHLKGGPVVSRLTGKVDAATQELIFQLLDAGLF